MKTENDPYKNHLDQKQALKECTCGNMSNRMKRKQAQQGIDILRDQTREKVILETLK